MKQQRKIHIKPSYIILGVILILLAAFCIRVAVWEHNYFARMEGSERASSGAYIDGQDVDEEKPDSTAIAEYEVAPDKPRYLTIRSLGIVNARIVEVGLKENQELATPVNIYDVGWYTGSNLPGTGVSVMDAHGGNAGQGIFRTLPQIGQIPVQGETDLQSRQGKSLVVDDLLRNLRGLSLVDKGVAEPHADVQAPVPYAFVQEALQIKNRRPRQKNQ